MRVANEAEFILNRMRADDVLGYQHHDYAQHDYYDYADYATT